MLSRKNHTIQVQSANIINHLKKKQNIRKKNDSNSPISKRITLKKPHLSL